MATLTQNLIWTPLTYQLEVNQHGDKVLYEVDRHENYWRKLLNRDLSCYYNGDDLDAILNEDINEVNNEDIKKTGAVKKTLKYIKFLRDNSKNPKLIQSLINDVIYERDFHWARKELNKWKKGGLHNHYLLKTDDNFNDVWTLLNDMMAVFINCRLIEVWNHKKFKAIGSY